jgi:uncharacterized protein YbjT (DUF2867 family)
LTDSDAVREFAEGATLILHLATGAPEGWAGLLEVDITGSREVFEAGRDAGVRRIIYASSNHVNGGTELDHFRMKRPTGNEQVAPEDMPRPDSPYGAAKAFAEAYGRYIAETSDTKVSCLRIGTVRPVDDPAAYADHEDFTHVPGGREGRLRRLRSTWLSHPDLRRIVDEEVEANEQFRVRFAVSDSPERFWSTEVASWTRPASTP